MLRGIGETVKLGNKFLISKSVLKDALNELKKPLTKEKQKHIMNGAVGIALLVGVVAIATPMIKAQLQIGTIDDIDSVTKQQETADFLQLNTLAVNYANSVLGDIYTFINTGFTAEQYQLLKSKQEALLEYQSQLSLTNIFYADISQNTSHKISIVLVALNEFIDQSSPLEEDIIKLNYYTEEYKIATEKEQMLLINLLDEIGMAYEIYPNGQIKYEYLQLSK